MTIRQLLSLLVAAVAVAACSAPNEPPPPPAAGLNDLAREYLFLELSMGQHDGAHVDAYFGPDEVSDAAQQAALSLDEIRDRAALLSAGLADARTGAETLEQVRINGLQARVRALLARIDLNEGKKLTFDEESLELFAVRAPDHDASHFEAILAEIETLLPGSGPLGQRVEAFRNQFAIPPDRLAEVFDAAIAECRERTLRFIELPAGESFTLEYVNDKPWSGYNWYQGRAQSLIQINTDLPIFISRAVDLGCHEGYPGHHTFNALLEKNLVEDLGWIEFSLYPLFSPQSLIAEGSGNYGVTLAFPGNERVEFEKSVLFPLAGLDAGEADRYYELSALLAKLSYAGNEAARDYLNGDITREQTVEWLVRYSLSGPERARQRTDFFDTYRSYVINYNLGKDMVQDYVEHNTDDQAARWAKFAQMLSTPVLPGDLAVPASENP